MRHRIVRTAVQALALASLACSPVLSAAEYTQSVPAELLEVLTDSQYYRELPPGFPVFTLPEGLSVIGSRHGPAAAPVTQQQVLLRSAPEGPVAQRAMVTELLAQGWVDVTREPVGATGFIVPGNTDYAPTALCHDDYGVMGVRGETGVENRVYLDLVLNARANANWAGCEAMRSARVDRPPGPPPVGLDPRGFLQYLPRLEAPAVAESGVAQRLYMPNLVGSRISARGEGFADRTTVHAPDLGVNELERHYAGQLRAQGWRRDTSWAGELTAGSTWTRRTDDGLNLLFSLSAARMGDGVYSVGIRMGERD